MKRIVSLVLAISMVFSMFVSAFAATRSFEDIEDTKYASSVEALVELGVIDGLPDGTYGPEKEVTRAQLAKMLVICLGLGDTVESLEGRTVFTDVADSHWASGYINAAVQSKVIAGYPDGTFKPEKNVSYAEAVTMVIRALGYGNVVDAEGTWPTAYMLKAVELELLDNMGSPKSGEPALRGNVAILLWNMLRTPMWKITSENQGTGMTSEAATLMLNVKFPDYLYVENVYLTDVEVGEEDVKATVAELEAEGYALNNREEYFERTAKIEDVDLSRLVIGMKVSTLIKDYKEADEAKFLTLTPEYSFVEGIVTDADSDENMIEIEEKEYKLADAEALIGEYVVAEVDGKKVLNIKTLPMDATEVEKLRTVESRIDEDALVIIEGEWSTRDDIEVGDMYTYMEEFDGYYMVARERIEGTFESYTWEDEDSTKVYIEVDGEKYDADENYLLVYEDEDNDTPVDFDDLREEEKDNKYLDKDVELVLNYLGKVMIMNFGDVPALNADGDIYAVTSNGYWDASTSSGREYYIELVGLDGEEAEAYKFESGFSFTGLDAIDEDLYAREVPVFVWVNFNAEGEIEELIVLNDAEALALGESDYEADTVAEEFDDDNSYLGDYKVSASTVVMTVTPVENDKEKVVGFEVEVSEGAEALEGISEAIVVYDIERANRATFVLVSEEAKSQDLNFGLVEKVREARGVVYATISGVEYKVNLDIDDYEELFIANIEAKKDLTFEDVQFVKNLIVAYTENNEKVTFVDVVAPSDLIAAGVVTDVVDEFVTMTVSDEEDKAALATLFTDVKGIKELTDGFELDISIKEVKDLFEKTQFIKAAAYTNRSNEVIFESEVEDLGEGADEVSFTKGDRVVITIDTVEGVIDFVAIVEGFAHDDVIVEDVNNETGALLSVE